MAISNILQKIQSDWEKESEMILSQARSEADKIKERYLQETEKSLHELKQKGEKKINSIEAKVVSLAEQQRKERILSLKRETIDHVFNEAVKDLVALSDEKKKRIYTKMFLCIDEQSGVVQPVKGEESLVSAAMKQAGKNFKVENSIKGKAGFLFVSKSVDMDFRFETIVQNELRMNLEKDIYTILFS